MDKESTCHRQRARLSSAIGLFLLITAGISSCRQKDLVFPEGKPERLEVVFDWERATGAAPEGMTLYFYPDDGHSRHWRFDIAGREGGEVEIPYGSYRMLAVNNDLQGVVFSDTESYDDMTANVRMLAGDTVASCTGMLYGGRLTRLNFAARGVSYTGPDLTECYSRERVVKVIPDSLATVYHVHLDSITGIERLRSVKALLMGVANTVDLSSQMASAGFCCISSTPPI